MADGSPAPFQSTRDRHAIADFRQHLTAAPQQGGTKQPRLSVYYHKNKITIEIRTNVDSDMNSKDHGYIRAELDPPMFFAFLAAFERVIKSPHNAGEAGTERIRVLRPDFQKKNDGNPVLDCTLVFGRNKDGAIFMTGLSWDKARPAIQFVFHPGKFVELIGLDGQKKSEADASTDIANGYLKQWTQLVPMYMFHRYVAEEYDRNKQGGGQGGGGGYNRGGGGGGYNNNRGGGYNNQAPAEKQEDMRSAPRSGGGDTPNWDDLPF